MISFFLINCHALDILLGNNVLGAFLEFDYDSNDELEEFYHMAISNVRKNYMGHPGYLGSFVMFEHVFINLRYNKYSLLNESKPLFGG